MSKVLLVDDEPGFREAALAFLQAEAHTVMGAGSGREAIDLGTRFRPDVLVADWVLRDDIHGGHVARTLRAVFPDLAVVLTTAYASEDLAAGFRGDPLAALLAKPFDLGRLRLAVADLLARRPDAVRAASVALVELGPGGEIRFTNDRAAEMLADFGLGCPLVRFDELFLAERVPNLDAAIDRWVVGASAGSRRQVWYLRSQEPLADGSRLVVLRRHNETFQASMSLLEMLLGMKDRARLRWPFEERVLVLDPDESSRHWLMSALESVAAGGYAVGTLEQACAILAADGGVRFVVVDLDLPSALVDEQLTALRAAHENLVIAGCATTSARRRMPPVDYVVSKPCRVADLIATLAGRLGPCTECGLIMPLRRPRASEQSSAWECAHCGARYQAVFDDDCQTDVLRNARSVGSG